MTPVAGPREGRAEHGADPAGADDPDGEPGGVLDAVHGENLPRIRRACSAGVTPGAVPAGGYRAAVVLPWREAWHEALYGPRGFYRRAEGPAGHFTTSTHGPLGALLADALGRLADREGVAPRRRRRLRPRRAADHARRARPTCGSPASTSSPGRPTCRMPWPGSRSPGGGGLPDGLDRPDDVLVVAHEWLDVVPCTVAEVVAPGRLVVVLVDPATGAESLGGLAAPDDWPGARATGPSRACPVETRVEVGPPATWPGATSSRGSGGGILLAVDYGHARGWPARAGHAHGIPGRRAGHAGAGRDVRPHRARRHRLARARRAHHPAGRAARLGLAAGTPPHDLARTDPAGYLRPCARPRPSAR